MTTTTYSISIEHTSDRYCQGYSISNLSGYIRSYPVLVKFEEGGYLSDSPLPQHLVVSEILLCDTFDQRFVRTRLDGNSLFEEPVEEFASAVRFAPVEPKNELVEVGIQTRLACKSFLRRSSGRRRAHIFGLLLSGR